MNILVTNDDGITSPGLLGLAIEMAKLGTVRILAPDRNWSASGHVKTLDRPLRVKEVQLTEQMKGWASDGAPSDCVALAICGFFDEKIDLVVSGINPYANLGHDVTYSGTVTAAMEATIFGVPAIAVSVDSPENLVGPVNYQPAANVACQVAEAVTRYGLTSNTLLNVNVPYLQMEDIKGLQITRMGLRVYHDKLDKRMDPRNRPYYWTFGEIPTGIPERGTDIGAISDGYVSITPIHLDLTAYQSLPDLNSWEWSLHRRGKISTVSKKADHPL
ncbi:MAG TPA: 5'/3'-nucleotidase SurE [Anaerolineaceae bacterium]|nr:5'/3'-nucleotidase SurE [Anaerolineaceae bacterium]HPN54130.1 5'/3'-nucleotidase SurE [Anaerolineaceae bacterium]